MQVISLPVTLLYKKYTFNNINIITSVKIIFENIKNRNRDR